MALNTFILFVMVCAGLWAVMSRSLLRAAIALALVSAVVSVLMFRLASPLAAVFELSVCSGLISVLFISTISLTSHETREEKAGHGRERRRRFVYLPFLIVALGLALSIVSVKLSGPALPPAGEADPRQVLWAMRPLDLLGQVVILLGGVFGVVLLFKGRERQ